MRSGFTSCPAMINSKIAAVDPTQFLQRLVERSHHRLRFSVTLGNTRQKTNPPHPIKLLRAAAALKSAKFGKLFFGMNGAKQDEQRDTAKTVAHCYRCAAQSSSYRDAPDCEGFRQHY
jgi:hypothetical protein